MGGSGIATCSVCGRISASGGDHLDCGEMRRARLADERIVAAARYEAFGGGGGGGDDLATEVRAVLDHIGEGDGPAQGPGRRPAP